MVPRYAALALWTLLPLLGAIGAHGKTANAPLSYRELDASFFALRQQFNLDAGHIRILMLLSPT
jgi:hypothetical protein